MSLLCVTFFVFPRFEPPSHWKRVHEAFRLPMIWRLNLAADRLHWHKMPQIDQRPLCCYSWDVLHLCSHRQRGGHFQTPPGILSLFFLPVSAQYMLPAVWKKEQGVLLIAFLLEKDRRGGGEGIWAEEETDMWKREDSNILEEIYLTAMQNWSLFTSP